MGRQYVLQRELFMSGLKLSHTLTVYSTHFIKLPNSIIIISLLVSPIATLTGFLKPPRTNTSYPPTITSHTQCGDIVTAVSE